MTRELKADIFWISIFGAFVGALCLAGFIASRWQQEQPPVTTHRLEIVYPQPLPPSDVLAYRKWPKTLILPSDLIGERSYPGMLSPETIQDGKGDVHRRDTRSVRERKARMNQYRWEQQRLLEEQELP